MTLMVSCANWWKQFIVSEQLLVMAGLVPAIHVFDDGNCVKAWMPATSAGMTRVDNDSRRYFTSFTPVTASRFW
jgi:hypothetical protein